MCLLIRPECSEEHVSPVKLADSMIQKASQTGGETNKHTDRQMDREPGEGTYITACLRDVTKYLSIYLKHMSLQYYNVKSPEY